MGNASQRRIEFSSKILRGGENFSTKNFLTGMMGDG